MPHRAIPLIVVATPSLALAEDIASRLRQDGNVVYVTHSPQACLRVATSLAPDVVLIDAAFPRHLEQLLRAHPSSAQARIEHVGQPPSLRRALRHVLHAA